MPKVNLKFLASLREVAGADTMAVDASTPRQALQDLDLLQAVLDKTPLVAVNHQIVDMDEALSEGDEVAFLPPMTGG